MLASSECLYIPGVTKTGGALKTRTTTTTKTTTTGLKSKTPATTKTTTTEVITTTTENKEAQVLTPPELNGELKIAQEESSVEVLTKQEQEPLILNGDAPH